MQGPFQSMAMMGGGCQASGPAGGMGGLYSPSQAMMGGKGGLPGFGGMGIMGMQQPPTMGGQFGGQYGTQAMSSVGGMGFAPMAPSFAVNPGWGQPMGGHAPLGGYNGHMPFHAMSPGARPGRQSMAGKRSASGGGGQGNSMKRKFATQCQTYAQIPVNFKMEVLQTIYPEVWNPVTSASKTMVDMDSCIAIGFDRWPGSPVETRSVTGLQCTYA